jgi:hypothetical protein
VILLEVITRFAVPLLDTAQKSPSSGDQQTLRQLLLVGLVRTVQVMPSSDVIMRLPVPEILTAKKSPSSGDQQTLRQLLSTALVRVVQVMPSGDVITRLPDPVDATAQKSPSSGDQQTEFQLLSAALVLVVHVMPSGDLITRLAVPEIAHAQKSLSSEDQQTENQLLSILLVLEIKPAYTKRVRQNSIERFVFIYETSSFQSAAYSVSVSAGLVPPPLAFVAILNVVIVFIILNSQKSAPSKVCHYAIWCDGCTR